MKWLLPVLLAAAGPLAGQTGCSYAASSGLFLFNGASQLNGSLTVTVSGGTGCQWSPNTNASWIHFTRNTYTATGTFTFTVDPNTGSTLLQDQIVITVPGGQLTVAVVELTGTCAYSLSPATPVSIPVGGGSGTFQVATGCGWTAGSTQSWLTGTLDSNNLTITSNNTTQSYGNGAVDYTVTANPCVAPRSASFVLQTGSIGPPALAFNQAGSNSNLTLSQTSLSTSSSATTGRISINTGNGCSWSAVSDSSWLQITSTTASSGPGSFAYSVLANTGPTRTGNITVGPATFTVTQQATPPPPITLAAVVNGSSYAQGAISPGEIVVLGGTNMGPAQGVAYTLSTTGQAIPSQLAGVQVLFGGLAAPLLYVSAVQINAIVPYGVKPGSNVTVQVQYQSLTSSLSVPVAAATPGIFSQDRSGLGPGAILNQDYSLNSTLSPATAGSVIQIFATGGGLTSPAVSDGDLAPLAEPLPRLQTVPISVTIGGLPSPQVTYAGDAPGLVAGLTQIDAVVPAGITPGFAVPVIITMGSVQSQTGITITVQ